MKVTKEQALEALQCLVEDFEMLLNGDWVPDEDSCGCSLYNAEVIRKYLSQE